MAIGQVVGGIIGAGAGAVTGKKIGKAVGEKLTETQRLQLNLDLPGGYSYEISPTPGSYHKWAPFSTRSDLLTDLHLSLYNIARNYYQPAKIDKDKPGRVPVIEDITRFSQRLSEAQKLLTTRDAEYYRLGFYARQFADVAKEKNPTIQKQNLEKTWISYNKEFVNTPLALSDEADKTRKYSVGWEQRELKLHPKEVIPAIAKPGVPEIQKVVKPSFKWGEIPGNPEQKIVYAFDQLQKDIKEGKLNPAQLNVNEYAIYDQIEKSALSPEVKSNFTWRMITAASETWPGRILAFGPEMVTKALSLIGDGFGKTYVFTDIITKRDTDFVTALRNAWDADPGKGFLKAGERVGIPDAHVGYKYRLWQHWKRGDTKFSEKGDDEMRKVDKYFKKFEESGYAEKYYPSNVDMNEGFKGTPLSLEWFKSYHKGIARLESLYEAPGIKEYLADNKALHESVANIVGQAAVMPLVSGRIEFIGDKGKRLLGAIRQFKATQLYNRVALQEALGRQIPTDPVTGKWTLPELGPVTPVKGVPKPFIEVPKKAIERIRVPRELEEVRRRVPAAKLEFPRVSVAPEVTARLIAEEKLRVPFIEKAAFERVKLERPWVADKEDIFKVLNERLTKEAGKRLTEPIGGVARIKMVKEGPPLERVKSEGYRLFGIRKPQESSTAVNDYWTTSEKPGLAVAKRMDKILRTWGNEVGKIDDLTQVEVPRLMLKYELVDRNGTVLQGQLDDAMRYLQTEHASKFTPDTAKRLVDQAVVSKKGTIAIYNKGVVPVDKLARRAGVEGLPEKLGYQPRYVLKDYKRITPPSGTSDASFLYSRAKAPADVSLLTDHMTRSASRSVFYARKYAAEAGWKGAIQNTADEAIAFAKAGDWSGFYKTKGALENLHLPTTRISPIPPVLEAAYKKIPMLRNIVDGNQVASTWAYIKMAPGYWPFNYVEENARVILMGRPKLMKLDPRQWKNFAGGFKDARGQTLNFGPGEGIYRLFNPSEIAKETWAKHIVPGLKTTEKLKVATGARRLADAPARAVAKGSSALRNALGKDVYYEWHPQFIKAGFTPAVAHAKAFNKAMELVNRVYIGRREGSELLHLVTRGLPFTGYQIGSIGDGWTILGEQPAIATVVNWAARSKSEMKKFFPGLGKGIKLPGTSYRFRDPLEVQNALDIIYREPGFLEDWLKKNSERKSVVGTGMAFLERIWPFKPGIVLRWFTDRTGITDERWQTTMPLVRTAEDVLGTMLRKKVSFFDQGLSVLVPETKFPKIDAMALTERAATESYEKLVKHHSDAWEWWKMKQGLYSEKNLDDWRRELLRPTTFIGILGVFGVGWSTYEPDYLLQYDVEREKLKEKGKMPVALKPESVEYRAMLEFLRNPKTYGLDKDEAKFLMAKTKASYASVAPEIEKEFGIGGLLPTTIVDVKGVPLSRREELTRQIDPIQSRPNRLQEAHYQVKLSPEEKGRYNQWNKYYRKNMEKLEGFIAEAEWFLSQPAADRRYMVESMTTGMREVHDKKIKDYETRIAESTSKKVLEKTVSEHRLSTPEEMSTWSRTQPEAASLELQKQKEQDKWTGQMIEIAKFYESEVKRLGLYDKFTTPPGIESILYKAEVLEPMRIYLYKILEQVEAYKKNSKKDWTYSTLGVDEWTKESIDRKLQEREDWNRDKLRSLERHLK